MNRNYKNIAVIGGGIVGLATAYKLLLKYGDKVNLTLVEKEPLVGQHQSGNNSGVLHAGLAYTPGSYKAVLSTSGIRQMVDFCLKHHIKHKICGKLVVAANDEEKKGLRFLLENGKKNGLTGLQMMNPCEISEREPFSGGVGGLLVPEEGIVDFPAVCQKLRELIVLNGGSILTSFDFHRLIHKPTYHVLLASDGRELQSQFTISCAGLYADKVCRRFGLDPGLAIVPFRGDYYELTPKASVVINHLIYPVAPREYPFLGVHFTRMVDGRVVAGPNAVLALAREGYTPWKINLSELSQSIRFRGLQKFMLRHPTMVKEELKSSFFKTAFLNRLKKLVPDLVAGDLKRSRSGVRAQAIDRKGNLAGDFKFVRNDVSLHLINAPSPAATASLAIGEWICRELHGAV